MWDQEALHAAAELAFAGGDTVAADKYADQLLALNAQNGRALLVKASVALKQGRLDDADGFISQVQALSPDDQGAQLLRARLLSVRNQNEEAVAILDKLAARNGDNAPTLVALLEIYRRTGDSANIEAVLARMEKLTPDNVDAQIDYARQLYRNGKNAEAFAVLDRVQQTKPADALLQARVADLWLDAGGDAVPAEAVARIAANGTPAMKVALARYLQARGRAAEAERILRPLAADDRITQANAEAHAIYAMTREAMGQREDALRRANAVLAFDATNSHALLLRARIRMAGKDLDGALADARLLQRDNPDLASTPIVLAEIYGLRQQDGLATGTFERALQDFPGNVDVLAAYVNYLISSNRRSQAMQVAETFTGRNPDLVPGWKIRADLCAGAHDADCIRTVAAALSKLKGGDAVMRGLPADPARESAGGEPARRRAA
ncbi:MAG: tetratricopeptide repeat protein [Sphingomonas sp.]|nr:tetratricopeptide repeat protein [Sphingomonas sp.]MDX3883578.1 tetratricopeptide repeat protein [Sphingomonas sp.]